MSVTRSEAPQASPTRPSPKQPLKRHPSLRPLSREHHEGLLFCWKIKTGLSREVEPDRIKAYALHFYREHLLPHFQAEEDLVFPFINDHSLVTEALEDHRRLRQLFSIMEVNSQALGLVVQLLEKHIRFEERVLFEHLQLSERIGELHEAAQHSAASSEWADAFWERNPRQP